MIETQQNGNPENVLPSPAPASQPAEASPLLTAEINVLRPPEATVSGTSASLPPTVPTESSVSLVATATGTTPSAAPKEGDVPPENSQALVLAREVGDSIRGATLINDAQKALVVHAIEKGQLPVALVKGALSLAAALPKEGMIGRAPTLPDADVKALMLHNAATRNLVPAATFEIVRMGKAAIVDAQAAMSFLAAKSFDKTISAGNRSLSKLPPSVQSELATSIADIEAMFQEHQDGIKPLTFACCICFLKETKMDVDQLETIITDEEAAMRSNRNFQDNVARKILGIVSDETIAHAINFFPELEAKLTELEKPVRYNRYTLPK